MAERFHLEHASTGDIFRRAVAEGSPLGREVEEYLDAGKLVPDELTSRVVEQMVVAQTTDYILDGYPRTLQQGRDLEEMLRRRSQQLDVAVYFDLSDELAFERLTGRRVCTECGANYHVKFMPPEKDGVCDRCGAELEVRSDSAEDVVRERLKQFREKTYPLVAFYEERGLLERVAAAPAPGEVARATEQVMLRARPQ